MDHRSTHLRGFSLVEAMVTLAIVGSLFALALPRLKPTLEQVADAQEVSQIVDALRRAQRLAIDGQCRVRVFSEAGELLRHEMCFGAKDKKVQSVIRTLQKVDVTLLPSGGAANEEYLCVDQACLRVTRSGAIVRESKDAPRGAPQ